MGSYMRFIRLSIMGLTSREKVELANYQLKDVAEV